MKYTFLDFTYINGCIFLRRWVNNDKDNRLSPFASLMTIAKENFSITQILIWSKHDHSLDASLFFVLLFSWEEIHLQQVEDWFYLFQSAITISYIDSITMIDDKKHNLIVLNQESSDKELILAALLSKQLPWKPPWCVIIMGIEVMLPQRYLAFLKIIIQHIYW